MKCSREFETERRKRKVLNIVELGDARAALCPSH